MPDSTENSKLPVPRVPASPTGEVSIQSCMAGGRNLSKLVVPVGVLVSLCAVEVVLLARREGANQPGSC